MYARSNNYLSSKSLTARYVIALSFIAMIITLSTYSFQRVIADQQYSSNTIARASADRFLLEQIKVYHVAFIASYGDSQHEGYRLALDEAASALEQNHQSLLDREASKNLGGEMNPRVKSLYFDPPVNLNKEISTYVAAARKLTSKTDDTLEDLPLLPDRFEDQTERLLESMHLVVQAHVDESENAIATMGQVEIALWGITMVILMLEALFIFRPMMSTIVDQLKVLDKKKTDAEKNLEHLKATRQALVESQRIVSLGRMVSGFSHELSTPLGIAVSATSQIEESIADLKDHLLTLPEGNNKNIDNNVTHITETALIASINLSRAGRLLDMFKQSSIDKYSEEDHEFNLSKLTQDTAQNLNHELKAKSVQVLVNCSDDITLEGKPSLLEQLITNLIVNSLTHGYPDGSVLKQTPTITINWRVDPIKETISLEYHDNGLGIDAAIADRLFEPFATNRPAQGRGLGLYICHTIVTQELKGTLRSDLTAGAGATFHAEFPLTV